MFIITVIEFLHENQWLNEQMIKECQIWFSMLIKLINFKNNHCQLQMWAFWQMRQPYQHI